MDNKTSQEASAEAVHKAKNAAQAIETARHIQTIEAADAAANRVTKNIGDIMQERMEHVLARGTEGDKAIILARVPYICQDIKGINLALKEIAQKMDQVKADLDAKDERNGEKYDKKYVTHDQFSPYKWTLVTIAGVVVTALAGAFMTGVLKTPQ